MIRIFDFFFLFPLRPSLKLSAIGAIDAEATQRKQDNHALHGEKETEVAGMARAQLGLLLVLGAQDIADAVQQLQVALLWVRRQTII